MNDTCNQCGGKCNWAVDGVKQAVCYDCGNKPVDQLIYCPRCLTQHVDKPEPDKGWTNPPHATHTCKFCGLRFRPSNRNTNGVEDLPILEPHHEESMHNCDPKQW